MPPSSVDARPQAFAAGEFVTLDGQVVGRHEGHQQFTVGQRKGLGVALGYPVYVTAIDAPTNRVTLGEKESLLSRGLIAREINLLGDELDASAAPVRCLAKIRYNHDPQPATASLAGPDEMHVYFDEPQSAITPGQAVVLYTNETVIGGGWIDSALPR